MWGAIKSDLIDFISTIKEDTSKTLSNVLGETSEDATEENVLKKAVSDLSRSFSTYNTEIDEKQQSSYQRFQKKFSLASKSSEIAALLDREVDVPRFYADLVPTQLQPEVFWSRYFFRLDQLVRAHAGGPGGRAAPGDGDDDEDDEELVWDEAAPASSSSTTAEDSASAKATVGGVSSGSAPATVNPSRVPDDTAQLSALQKECAQLRATVKSLANRVAELEAANNKLTADNAALRKRVTDSGDTVVSESPLAKPVPPTAPTSTTSAISANEPKTVPIVAAPVSAHTTSVPPMSPVDSGASLECDSESDSTGGAVLISSRPAPSLARSSSPGPAARTPAPHKSEPAQKPSPLSSGSGKGNSGVTSAPTASHSSGGDSAKAKVSAKGKSGSTVGKSLLEEDEEEESWD